MKGEYNPILNMKKGVILSLTIFAICIIGAMHGYTYAKYKSEVNAVGMAKIAKPVMIIDKAEELKLDALNTDGTYVFTVKNYNDTEINEIEMQYYIEILGYDLENIELELTRNGENVDILDGKTEEFELLHTTKMDDEFILKIKYIDSSKKKDVNGNIQVAIHSKQA